jgi:uncharacterized membrane protein
MMNKKRGMESHIRSILKAITWRFGGTLVTFGIAYVCSGQIEIALKIGLLDTVVKVFAFYAHERAWNRVSLGKTDSPDFQI